MKIRNGRKLLKKKEIAGTEVSCFQNPKRKGVAVNKEERTGTEVSCFKNPKRKEVVKKREWERK